MLVHDPHDPKELRDALYRSEDERKSLQEEVDRLEGITLAGFASWTVLLLWLSSRERPLIGDVSLWERAISLPLMFGVFFLGVWFAAAVIGLLATSLVRAYKRWRGIKTLRLSVFD